MKTQEEIEQLAKNFADDAQGSPNATFLEKGFINGYTQCQKDMANKKYTEEDMLNAFRKGANVGSLHERLSDYDSGDYADAEEYYNHCEQSFIESIQPKTEW